MRFWKCSYTPRFGTPHNQNTLHDHRVKAVPCPVVILMSNPCECPQTFAMRDRKPEGTSSGLVHFICVRDCKNVHVRRGVPAQRERYN
jgi:hypothetical protein